MDAEKIANKARKSISTYCFEECKSYCCRKGYLILTPKEARKTTQNRIKELEGIDIINKIGGGSYSLYMGNKDYPCPSLKDCKCIIHKSKNRSATCRKFPIFLDEENKIIKLSARCNAVKDGKFYSFIKRWMSLGYEVVEGNK